MLNPKSLFISYTSSLSLRKKTEEKGFTLIELLVTVIIIGVLSGIGLPIYLKQVEKARSTEATYTLSSINKAQQTRMWENGQFANDFIELELNMTSPKYYEFTWVGVATVDQVHHLATPKTPYVEDLKTYTSAVFREGELFYSVMCEGTNVGDTPSLTDKSTCTNGKILGN